MKSIKILVAISLINMVFVILTARVVKPNPVQPRVTIPNNSLDTGKFEENQVVESPSPSVTPQQTPKNTTPSPITNPPPKASPTSTSTPTPTPKVATPTPTPTPTITPVATPTPTPDNRCLIQIDGVTYNVTSLRQTHSGGDIFSCGTDMSQIFWSQHNQRIWNIMQQYRI